MSHRVEKIKGHWCLLGGLIPNDRVHAGQRWVGSSGATVEIDEVDYENGWVDYFWFEADQRKTHSKTIFAFQSRYSLILPENKLPDWIDNVA